MMMRRIRMAVAVVAIPVLVGVVAWAVTKTFADELPDPVATHWGPGGSPDGFTELDRAVVIGPALAAAFGLVLGAVLWVFAARVPTIRRGSGAMAGFLSAFIGSLAVGSLWGQRGLTDAREASDVMAPVAVALLLGFLVAGLGALIAGGERSGAALARDPIPVQAWRIPLAATERAAWTGWARSGPVFIVAVIALTAPIVALGALGGGFVLPGLVLAVIGLALLATTTFRVSVGEPGLRVRSIAGWPCFHVPLAEVAQASTTKVRPMRDFGGWGIRANRSGAFGVIVRGGAALEVARGDGTRFVVTLDHPEEAAGLLNTLAERQRAPFDVSRRHR